MGTKNRKPPVELVETWLRQGFGQGDGASYKPFMNVRDVPSQGLSHMVRSDITSRVHHYLSLGEQGVHLLAEFSGNVLDVREQYALLPWPEMQEIASSLGIRYPKIPYTSTPVVLTTDLVITVEGPEKKELIAIAVKPQAQLNDPRVLEKLWLERFYWNRRGIKWRLHSVEPTRVKNLRFFEGGLRHRKEYKALGVGTETFAAAFERNWKAHLSYNEICNLAAGEFGMNLADGANLFSAAVWDKVTSIDLDSRQLKHSSPVLLRTLP